MRIVLVNPDTIARTGSNSCTRARLFGKNRLAHEVTRPSSDYPTRLVGRHHFLTYVFANLPQLRSPV
jgi:hypothetical protein